MGDFEYYLCISSRPPTPLTIQDVCELEPLTDVETEHAVQALQRQGSSFNTHLSSPTMGLLSCGQGSPSPEVQLPIPDPDTPPADIQPVTADTDCHPRSSSPAMPVLDIELQVHDPARRQHDTPHLSSCPDTPCLSPDPYSLPPVLSPQVPYPSNSMELHCLYSDPPVLSPQQYPAEEAVEGHACEMDCAESVFESIPAVTIPVFTPHLPSLALSNSEGVHEESRVGFNGIKFSSNSLECATLFSHRSHSLPQHSSTTPNPKKRCRSASPEHKHRKRRRKTANSGICTEKGNESVKPESDIMAKSYGCLLSDKTCTLETLGSKQTFTTFCIPTVHNFTQRDILGQGCTLVSDQQSWPKTSDPPLQLPNEKSHSPFSSQDSQRSLSHSTSVCIESALIPDLAKLSSSSSDSDWDCELLSRLGPSTAAPLSLSEQSRELDKELLHRPCTWMHDTSYESRLHTALQPTTPTTSLCGEDMDPSAFSRTVVQIVEVQHWWLFSGSFQKTGRTMTLQLHIPMGST